MRLAETSYDNTLTGCCGTVDEARWDEQRVTWHDKLFLRDHVRSFLHVPLNFGAVMRRDHAAVEAAAAYPEEPIWLTDEVSPWGSDFFMATDREVPGARMERLSGTFLTKVFEGPFRDAGKWVQQMGTYVRTQGEEAKRMSFFYPTCPKCARRLGKNQVVLFAQVD
ncbi:MAG: hypothetical protein FJ207_14140 [Gemmatimonadetes bacterium]|nr:hypothetical protein [Gemmatimonadota bacterium]